jgi:hypothetical protein
LLIGLVGKANETITSWHARDGICHDLGGFAWWKTSLEQWDQDVLIDLGAKIANKDRVFRATVITAMFVSLCIKHAARIKVEEYEPGFWPSISESTTGCPIKLERSGCIGDHWTIKRKSLCGGGRRSKVDEAVTSVAAES